MAKSAHTFEFFGPTNDIVEQFTGPDTINATLPNIKLRKVVEIEDAIFADAKMEYESKHWVYVGAGDQVSSAESMIEVYTSSPLSTGNDGELIDLTWDAEQNKNNFVHSTSVDPELIATVERGRYHVFGMIKLVNDPSLMGVRVMVKINDVTVMDFNAAGIIGYDTSIPISNAFYLNAGDDLKVQVGSLGVGNVSIVSGLANTYLKIVQL